MMEEAQRQREREQFEAEKFQLEKMIQENIKFHQMIYERGKMKPEVERDFVTRKKEEEQNNHKVDEALVNYQHIKRLKRELEEEQIKLE